MLPSVDHAEVVSVIHDEDQLRNYGVCRAKLPFTEMELRQWASTLSQTTPLNFTVEAAGENAFYRNIIDEPDFPFHQILDASSDIARVVKQKFIGNGHEESELNGALGNVLRLDDAFCIHYNLQQHDTQCAKHTDPSDITVNMCLGCSDDMEGSMVVFFGMQPLLLTGKDCISDGTPAKEESGVDTKLPVEVDDGTAANKIVFAVKQNPGYATIHWGHHLHQTTRLTKGSRTNIVLTYCYKDKSRSKAHSRTCYVTS